MEYLTEVEKNIQQNVVIANGELVEASKQRGITIYGNIAAFLEEQESVIDQLAEKIGTYLALKKGIELTQEYEENSSFVEKYIKNNSLKLAELEIKEKSQTDMIVGGTQIVLKGATFLAKKVFAWIDEKKVKESIWNLCVVYANAVTRRKYVVYPQVESFLQSISRQLFGKSRNDYMVDRIENVSDMCFPNGDTQIKNISFVLYMIYSQKHLWTCFYEDKEEDVKELLSCWAVLGIVGNEAIDLFKRYEDFRVLNAFDYSRLNTAIQNVYNNLCITIPNINMTKAREINSALLQYVPNGDKQMAVRNLGKFIGKSTIATAGVIGGIKTENPILIEIAATTAVSLLNDLNNTEVIGNCLRDCGLDGDMVRKCIESGKEKQKISLL